MESSELAEILADKTLKIHDLDKALNFILLYLEGLQVFEPVDQEQIIQLIAEKDQRFLKGQVKEILFLENDKFNPNGTLYIGKNKALEARKEGYTGILYIIKKAF